MKGCTLISLRLSGSLALLVCVATLRADPPRHQARPQETVMDVSLNGDSVLEGYLIDPFGKVLKDTTVTIVQNRKVVWTGKTNAEGHFQVKGLSSGVYHVGNDAHSTCCRVWANESAPPRASRSLLLTRDLKSSRGSGDSHADDLSVRVSGFSTLTLPRMFSRDVRKLISP
ncbi:carboxypeptidase-like regulatory domain-containing protein [Planctomicrobium sp. SH661]|uniref:carboxypeptidase-like regulatory domain-containing protein n=1 Tax=Planctomicrobium sp. SH661 TaxID=3448124 RepID=UPI003F5B4DA0